MTVNMNRQRKMIIGRSDRKIDNTGLTHMDDISANATAKIGSDEETG